MSPYKRFGDIDPDHSSYPSARVAILPVPYERTTTYRSGTGDAPSAIIDASAYIELYDEELNIETFRIGIHTCPPLKFELPEPHRAIEEIEKKVAIILRDDKFPVIIGGEHTVTIGAVRAFVHKYPSLNVLQLDAHADLRDHYRGNFLSHACTMRRIREICPAVQVGIRSISSEEVMVVREKGWKIHYFHEIRGTEKWIDEILEDLSDPTYITIDMDFFNPSEVPSVGTPEPGGMGWFEGTKFLKKVMAKKNVVGFDVVELCPQEGNTNSDFFAAKLIYRLIGYRFFPEIGQCQ